MSTLAIDTYKLLTTLKRTGKRANFTAEEIANAVDVAQEGAELLTRTEFGVRMDAFDARMDAFESRIVDLDRRMLAMEGKFDAKLDRLEARIDAKLEALRAELKSSQLRNMMWLSGIVLASNGMTIALLARVAHVV
jgi:hypothetical protein